MVDQQSLLTCQPLDLTDPTQQVFLYLISFQHYVYHMTAFRKDNAGTSFPTTGIFRHSPAQHDRPIDSVDVDRSISRYPKPLMSMSSHDEDETKSTICSDSLHDSRISASSEMKSTETRRTIRAFTNDTTKSLPLFNKTFSALMRDDGHQDRLETFST